MPQDRISPGVAQIAGSFFSGPTPLERALSEARTKYYDNQAQNVLAQKNLRDQEHDFRNRVGRGWNHTVGAPGGEGQSSMEEAAAALAALGYNPQVIPRTSANIEQLNQAQRLLGGGAEAPEAPLRALQLAAGGTVGAHALGAAGRQGDVDAKLAVDRRGQDLRLKGARYSADTSAAASRANTAARIAAAQAATEADIRERDQWYMAALSDNVFDDSERAYAALRWGNANVHPKDKPLAPGAGASAFAKANSDLLAQVAALSTDEEGNPVVQDDGDGKYGAPPEAMARIGQGPATLAMQEVMQGNRNLTPQQAIAQVYKRNSASVGGVLLPKFRDGHFLMDMDAAQKQIDLAGDPDANPQGIAALAAALESAGAHPGQIGELMAYVQSRRSTMQKGK